MKKKIRFIIISVLVMCLMMTTSCQLADQVAKQIVENKKESMQNTESLESVDVTDKENLDFKEEINEEKVEEKKDDKKGKEESEKEKDKNAESQKDKNKKPAKKVTVSGEKRVVGYYTSWSAYGRKVYLKDIDLDKITHINFAFANLSGEGEIIIGDSWVDIEMPMDGDGGWATQDLRGHYKQLQILKEKNPDLKTLISVGGWTWSKNFSQVAADPAKRQNFAKSAVKFVTEYGFDGVDIDWEFPVEGGDNISHLPEDKENYTLLVKDIREALDAQGEKDGKHYLLTIAAGPNPSFAENTEFAKMAQYLDFINVMSYDYHGGWENVTGHNAPLYASEGLCVDDTIQAYLDTGIDPSMLNLGLAFYGRGWQQVSDSSNNGLGNAGTKPNGTGVGVGTWEGGVFDYWDLEQNYVDKNGYKKYFDEEALVPYLYNGQNFITYDDAQSIGIKVDYALAKGLGGVMYWEFSGDKNFVLQDAIMSRFSTLRNGEKITVDTPQGVMKPKEKKDKEDKKESSYPAWNSETVYNGGEIVSFEGNNYRAKWWTQREKPDANSSEGVWERVN